MIIKNIKSALQFYIVNTNQWFNIIKQNNCVCFAPNSSSPLWMHDEWILKNKKIMGIDLDILLWLLGMIDKAKLLELLEKVLGFWDITYMFTINPKTGSVHLFLGLDTDLKGYYTFQLLFRKLVEKELNKLGLHFCENHFDSISKWFFECKFSEDSESYNEILFRREPTIIQHKHNYFDCSKFNEGLLHLLDEKDKEWIKDKIDKTYSQYKEVKAIENKKIELLDKKLEKVIEETGDENLISYSKKVEELKKDYERWKIRKSEKSSTAGKKLAGFCNKCISFGFTEDECYTIALGLLDFQKCTQNEKKLKNFRKQIKFCFYKYSRNIKEHKFYKKRKPTVFKAGDKLVGCESNGHFIQTESHYKPFDWNSEEGQKLQKDKVKYFLKNWGCINKDELVINTKKINLITTGSEKSSFNFIRSLSVSNRLDDILNHLIETVGTNTYLIPIFYSRINLVFLQDKDWYENCVLKKGLDELSITTKQINNCLIRIIYNKYKNEDISLSNQTRKIIHKKRTWKISYTDNNSGETKEVDILRYEGFEPGSKQIKQKLQYIYENKLEEFNQVQQIFIEWSNKYNSNYTKQDKSKSWIDIKSYIQIQYNKIYSKVINLQNQLDKIDSKSNQYVWNSIKRKIEGLYKILSFLSSRYYNINRLAQSGEWNL